MAIWFVLGTEFDAAARPAQRGQVTSRYTLPVLVSTHAPKCARGSPVRMSARVVQ